MKNLRNFMFFILILSCRIHTFYAMENPDQYKFTQDTLDEIYEFAGHLGEAIGQQYKIVNNTKDFILDLNILGISSQDKLLDIRYHYFLLKQELEKGTPGYKVVKNAYNRILYVLLEIDNIHFQQTLYNISCMSLKEVKELKLEHVIDRDLFIKNKDKLIQEKARSLNKKLITMDIQTALGLPKNIHVSDDVLKNMYDNYMQKNSIDKLIAQQRIGDISSHELKEKIAEIEEIKRTYNSLQ